MAIKRIITKAEYEKLSKELQAEYNLDGDTATLDLTDYEDPAALKRAKDHEKEQRKQAEKAVKDAQDALTAMTEERDNILRGALPKADVDKLEKSWKDKMAARETELTNQLGAANASLQKVLVDNVAQAIATKISTAPALIMPHIKARLKTEQVGSEFVTRVLDREGKPSALTVEELEKEFVVNKDFAPIITASKGSGTGGGGSGGGGAPAGGNIDFNKSPKEIAASLKASGKIKED